MADNNTTAPASAAPLAEPPKRRRLKLASRLAVDAEELGLLLDCGVRSVRTWDYAGKLPRPVELGARRLWYLPEIRAWLRAGAPSREAWEIMRKQKRKN